MPELDPFNPANPPPKWDGPERVSERPMDVLAEFVHGCSKDPATRTVAVTLFVTSLSQLTGQGMTSRMPSTIVVNAHNLVPDPTDLLASRLVASPEGSGPRVDKEGHFMHGTPEQAPCAMVNAILEKQELGKLNTYNASIHHGLEERYFAAQRTGFGYGPSRSYAGAWYKALHLITDRNNEVVLRINGPKDRAAFYKHVIKGDKKLRHPLGYGAGLKLVPKHIALSGSLPISQWDARLASGIIDLSLPLMMLPSTTKAQPKTPNGAAFSLITKVLPRAFSSRVDEPANLIQAPWFEAYGRELRARLHHLPADYEYSMQKLARQLAPICLRIAHWCSSYSGSSREEINAMTYDLCGHALRGLVISVAGLAWHGLGIDTKCPHQTIMRVLEYLRSREPMTKSELLRGAHLVKEERDQLLECLAAEGLIKVDGKVVSAVSYPEFVERLYRRQEFPAPINHWAALPKKNQPAS